MDFLACYRYDLGLISGALPEIRRVFFHDVSSPVWESMIVAAAKFGAVPGTFIGGASMLYYGRLKAIVLGSTFFMAGPFLMAIAIGPWYAIPSSCQCTKIL